MFEKNYFIKIFFLASLFTLINCKEKDNRQKWLSEETTNFIQMALSSLPDEQIPNEFKSDFKNRDKLFRKLFKRFD